MKEREREALLRLSISVERESDSLACATVLAVLLVVRTQWANAAIRPGEAVIAMAVIGPRNVNE
jgi:hypothetical protein